ncbi:MAG: hypothetical protein ACT4OX_04025 [Actinomycetota bacterium]
MSYAFELAVANGVVDLLCTIATRGDGDIAPDQDPVDLQVNTMDRCGVLVGLVDVSTSDDARRAVREHPHRFLASWSADPNRGMDTIRDVVRAVEQHDVRAVEVAPAHRIFAELPNVPFRDHVWPKLLYENAARVLNLD